MLSFKVSLTVRLSWTTDLNMYKVFWTRFNFDFAVWLKSVNYHNLTLVTSLLKNSEFSYCFLEIALWSACTNQSMSFQLFISDYSDRQIECHICLTFFFVCDLIWPKRGYSFVHKDLNRFFCYWVLHFQNFIEKFRNIHKPRTSSHR